MNGGTGSNGVKRRDFLKILGTTGAATAAVGCGTGDVERLIPYLVSPDNTVPGVSTYYATTCRECETGCGVLAEVRDGRAFKLEGNPAHPASRGAICSRGLAAVQGLYNPDRWKRPMLRRGGQLVAVEWEEALDLFTRRVADARAGGLAGAAVFLNQAEQGAFPELLDQWLQAQGMPPHMSYDAGPDAAVIAAHRDAYGVDWPGLDFGAARLIVSFGADFLDTWGASIPQQLDYADARANLAGAPRLVYIGARRSLTGLNADSWIPARPGSELLIARALAGGSVEEAAAASDVPAATLQALSLELASARPSMLLAGGTAAGAYELASAVASLNRSLGNVGVTIRPDRAVSGTPSRASFAQMWTLTERMAARQVPLLFVRGANPVYSMPASLRFAEAMDRVPFKVSFSSYPDETSLRCDLILPDHHPLEQWGAMQAAPGVIATQQPTMDPVFGTRATGDVLLETAAADPQIAGRFASRTFREWVMDRFPGGAATFTAALARGVAAGTLPGAGATVAGGAQTGAAVRPPPPPLESTEGEFFLHVYPHSFLRDGSGANKPWLQEIPDPVAKISWQSWIEVHPSTAARLDVREGDVLEVRTGAGSFSAPAWIYPGIRPDTVAIATGRGHTAYGRFAEGVGVNPLAALPAAADPRSGTFNWMSTRARVRKTGAHERLVSTEGSARQQGRGIAQAIVATELPSGRVALHGTTGAEHAEEVAPRAPDVVGEPPATGHRAEEHGGGTGGHTFMGAAKNEFLPGLRAPVADDAEGALGSPDDKRLGMYRQDHWSGMASRRWAMTIDLARCTGCSACITACYSENNLPTVGAKWQSPSLMADQEWGGNIVKGREMTWIRLERYYEGGEHFEERLDPDFETRFVPMLCQHCGNAPCEPVCPVFATYHSPDGLNVQVYNRCVGTRYCSNNCPYKVRYFNWFGYGEPDRPQYAWPEPMNWILNPDVNVRAKGVMEKCTFCVQRIREAENRAGVEGRPLEADEFTTACAQACPSRAIVFGDAADESWSVARMVEDPRSYHVFQELNTYTAVVYLKKINHPAPSAPAGA